MSHNFKYLHLDKTAWNYATVIEDCRQEHEANHPTTKLSVNSDQYNKEAIVKVDASNNWTPPWLFSEAVKAIYNESGHNTVLDIVKSESWTGPQEL